MNKSTLCDHYKPMKPTYYTRERQALQGSQGEAADVPPPMNNSLRDEELSEGDELMLFDDDELDEEAS